MATVNVSKNEDLEMVEVEYLRRESPTSKCLVSATLIGYLIAVKPKTIHIAPMPNTQPAQAKCIRRHYLWRVTSLSRDTILPL